MLAVVWVVEMINSDLPEALIKLPTSRLNSFNSSHSLLHHGNAAQAPSVVYDTTAPALSYKPQPNHSKLCYSCH